MVVMLNTPIELGFLMKTWFSNLVFKCISLRRIWIIQWSFTWRVRTLLFLFTLSCMAAKCGHPLGEMNFQKRFTEVLITSYTFIWEAAVAIVFRFFFNCWSEYCNYNFGLHSELVFQLVIVRKWRFTNRSFVRVPIFCLFVLLYMVVRLSPLLSF